MKKTHDKLGGNIHIKNKTDEKESISILEPDGELSEADFKAASDITDPYLEKSGKLKGLNFGRG